MTDATKANSTGVGGNDDRKEMQQLEQAYLYLMEEFRKAYLADQVQKDSKVYVSLGRELGIDDEMKAIKLYAQKM